MITFFFNQRLRRHAERVFGEIFPEGFEGEVFLCGGAFKPLLRRRLPINDFDLWVRNRKDREKLVRFLLQRGASLVRDFHPFCLKLRLNGRIIEITYHNINDGTLSDVVNTFDMAVCGLAARYKNGSVVEVHTSEECRESIRRRSIRVLPAYQCFLDATHAPSLIRTLHRMGQHAAELGYEVDVLHEHMLWEVFWKDYTEEERRAAVDLYFETMVHYKGHCDDRLVRRATVGYMPQRGEKPDDLHHGHLTPRHV
jgi:hypothetical protein